MTSKERPTRRTERLVLRPFTLADAPEVRRLAGDAAIADTTLMIPHPYEAGMAEEWIGTHATAYESGQGVHFAVTLREGGTFLGAIGLSRNPRFENAEVGYWIGRPYWNHGYATEALRAVIAYAFEDLGLHRVHASHLPRNPASGRVMQKAGMRREGLRREHAKKGDRFEDLVLYGLLRSEWAGRPPG